MSSFYRDLRKEEIEELLNRCGLGYLGTIGNGQPYVTPVTFAYKDRTLYFNTLAGAKKVENIQQNPKVCLLIRESKSELMGGKQISVFGEAERLEGKEAMEARKIQLEKFTPESLGTTPRPGVIHYRVSVKKIVGRFIGG